MLIILPSNVFYRYSFGCRLLLLCFGWSASMIGAGIRDHWSGQNYVRARIGSWNLGSSGIGFDFWDISSEESRQFCPIWLIHFGTFDNGNLIDLIISQFGLIEWAINIAIRINQHSIWISICYLSRMNLVF